ncbi:MAG: terminase, partial [Culicoidibacterales bacterium]
NAGAADGQIFQVNQSDVATIGKKMEKEGVSWKPADKSAGSRKNGWQLIRDMLQSSLDGQGEGLYFTKACKYAKKFIPDTPRDETNLDDIDTGSEDHLQDELRYRVLDNSQKYSRNIKIKFAT